MCIHGNAGEDAYHHSNALLKPPGRFRKANSLGCVFKDCQWDRQPAWKIHGLSVAGAYEKKFKKPITRKLREKNAISFSTRF